MKGLWNVLEKDIKSENFTAKECVIYGFVYPVGLVLILGLAGWIDTLCN